MTRLLRQRSDCGRVLARRVGVAVGRLCGAEVRVGRRLPEGMAGIARGVRPIARLCRPGARGRSRSRAWLTASVGLLVAVVVSVSGGGFARASVPQLTGTFYGDDNGVYYLQQVGSTVWWMGESVDAGMTPLQVWRLGLASTSVFEGTVSGSTLSGNWVEVSRGAALGVGTVTMSIGTDGSGNATLSVTGGSVPSSSSGSGSLSQLTQGDPVNDFFYQYPDHTALVDFFNRFELTKKSIGPGVSDLDGGDPLGQTDNPHQLRPYRDETVFYGNLQTVSPDGATNNWPQVNVPAPGSPGAWDWSYSNFACKAADGDIDMNMRVDGTSMTTDFLSGLGWSNQNAADEDESGSDSQDILPKLETGGSFTNGFNLHLESIMYGGDKVSGCPSTVDHFLPGWADSGGNSLIVNGRPVDAFNHPENMGVASSTTRGVASGSFPLGSLNGIPLVPADPPNGIPTGTEVRVTGAMILDCGHSAIDDDENYEIDTDSFPYVAFHSCEQGESDQQNQEIHPIYSIDLIECPLGYAPGYCPSNDNTARANLTGAWGSNDGGTYYIRQLGNEIWWAGLTRDRDPTTTNGSTGLPNPIPNPTDVFHGTISYNADGTATITGNAVTVPKGNEGGGDTTSATFTVGADRKSMDLVSTSSSSFPWPVHFDKLYEPSDTTAPSSSISIGSPQSTDSGTGRKFVTNSTPLTLSSADSDVQNLWYRIYRTGSTPPAYTPVAGSTTTFDVTGADGSYTIDSYATDNSGNDESPHQLVVTLDDTAPVATITQPTATNYTHADSFNVGYTVSDGSGSGVKSSSATLDGTSVGNGQAISLLNTPLGSHTFAVAATDNLGNSGTKTVVFTITVTAQSIEKEVNEFVALGKIKSQLTKALLSTLTDAASARANGNCSGAAADYQAFINQVNAQVGKGIDPTAAATLTGDANYLITHCP